MPRTWTRDQWYDGEDGGDRMGGEAFRHTLTRSKDNFLRIVDATFPNRVDRLPLAARRLRSLHGLLFWSRRAAMLSRQCGVEFIWCGNMKPASYPAKWTMETLPTPDDEHVQLVQVPAETYAVLRFTGDALEGGGAVDRVQDGHARPGQRRSGHRHTGPVRAIRDLHRDGPPIGQKLHGIDAPVIQVGGRFPGPSAVVGVLEDADAIHVDPAAFDPAAVPAETLKINKEIIARLEAERDEALRADRQLEFTQRLIALRRAHPVFHRRDFLTGQARNGSGLPARCCHRPLRGSKRYSGSSFHPSRASR